MRIHIHIDSESNARELLALSNFTRELSVYLGGGAITSGPLTAPPDEAELAEPETVVVGGTVPAETQAAAEAPKRRRRTKAEMEADAAAAAATLPEVPEEPVGAEQGTVPEVSPEATPLVETPAATETVAAAPSKPAVAAYTVADGAAYTAADVQKMAVDAARRFGPEKVKALIAEYPGATKIADLLPADLAGFVGKLNALEG